MTAKRLSSSTWTWLAGPAFLGLSLVSLTNRSLFDDELYNLSLIQSADNVGTLVSYVNRADVHPPLSYVINYYLYHLFGSYRGVWAIGAVMYALALQWAVKRFNDVESEFSARLIFIIMTVLSSNVLLWNLSLRWYSYFLPLSFPLILGLALAYGRGVPTRKGLVGAGILMALLTYLSYLAFLVVIAAVLSSLAIHTLIRRRPFREFIVDWIPAGLLYGVLCLPQIYVLLTLQYGDNVSQKGGLLKSFLFSWYTPVAGNGLFPLAPLAILAMLVGGGVLLFALIKFRSLPSWSAFGLVFFIVSLFLLTVSGIGFKARNSMYTALPMALIFAGVMTRMQRPWLKALVIGSILIASASGTLHVLASKDTLKNNFNIQPWAVQEAILAEPDCDDPVIFTHDPQLTYYMAHEYGFRVLSLYSLSIPELTAGATAPSKKVARLTLPAGTCAVWLGTFRGSIAPADFHDVQKALAQIESTADSTSIKPLFPDTRVALKRRLSGRSDLPDHLVGMRLFRFARPVEIDLADIPWFHSGSFSRNQIATQTG
jgi:hypothetical protein